MKQLGEAMMDGDISISPYENEENMDHRCGRLYRNRTA